MNHWFLDLFNASAHNPVMIGDRDRPGRRAVRPRAALPSYPRFILLAVS
jgi:hypothetical protein